ncbi:MAG TPA: alpha-amylase family glycosyl hydrolase [Niastella sp.]|nr:alpha-amylase family glycosyl hydrolase [Niastella sp.]
MKHFQILILLFFFSIVAFAQDSISVYPSHWWTGMKSKKLQLMVHYPNIGTYKAVGTDSNIYLVGVNRVENKNYLFLNLEIKKNIKPGKFEISFFRPHDDGSPNEVVSFYYELKPRRNGNGTAYAQGVTQKDLIYLLMPDRFSNGDTTNDIFRDMRDTAHSRSNPFDRHGGDLQGVINHMDYLQRLGVTTVWMTPVVENDMARTKEGNVSRSTYHGYAFTDQYKIDKRFGGNEIYKKLVAEAHANGMKIIQDAVYNHLGADHFSIRDMPMKDWVNQWPQYQNTSYKDGPLVDPHAADIDREISVSGWFTPFLADLNQRNPYVANFLIQYAIWATEEFGVDGWRVDTYFYNDPRFLNSMNTALLAEFPKLTVFGETLVSLPVNAAFFTQNNLANIPFKHNTQGITDNPLTIAMLDGLNQPFDWSGGVNRVYNTVAQDILYKDPTRNCIFLDNHDLDRVFSVVGEDTAKFKMGLNWLLTLRGIPQLYYGTEILMKNFRDPTDAEVRRDFPGGWAGDSSDKFKPENRTAGEQNAWQYTSALANFRKTSKAIGEGKLMQYVPENGLYVYFRYHPQQTVMVVSHTGVKEMTITMNRFVQRTSGFTKMKNVIAGDVRALQDFTIQPKQSFVFELLK